MAMTDDPSASRKASTPWRQRNDGSGSMQRKGSWLTYRPDLQVMDVTLRDGGLMNNHGFDDDFVRAIYQANLAAGVDYMEFGYKASKKIYSPTEFGPWKYCAEDDVRRIVDDHPGAVKFSVMADAERTDYHEDILPAGESVFDLIRVATYIHQMATALDMIQDAHNKGYEVTLQLMAISVVAEKELDEALDLLAETPISTIYLVDSFGALYSEQIHYLTRKYLRFAEATGKEVGLHTHNNQQLAYANTIEGIMLGVHRVDASIGGLGRGAGNCPMELLLGFLHNPKYHLRPVLQCIQDHIAALRQQFHWGYDVAYMLTGQLNQHPRSAMKHIASGDRDAIVDFYDALIEEE